MTTAGVRHEPRLPTSRGPLSATVINRLAEGYSDKDFGCLQASTRDPDPLGIDIQLTLYVCYELHYRGFADVDPEWEWNADLLGLRGQLEGAFLAAIRHEIGDAEPERIAVDELDRLSIEPLDGEGPTHYLRNQGTWEHMREYFVHRSLYHLKEGDPHAWAIPRLTGQAKASFVAVEFDEYGGGRGNRVHQRLFADLLDAAGLDSTYLGYIDAVPAESLAAVNLMSLFGLHRSLLGAALGHFAATEITSPPGSRRLVEALERMGAPEPCIHFYREHVEADAVHEQVVRADVVGALLTHEPHLDADVVFGVRARDFVEDRLANHMMESWAAESTSLCRPLS